MSNRHPGSPKNPTTTDPTTTDPTTTDPKGRSAGTARPRPRRRTDPPRWWAERPALPPKWSDPERGRGQGRIREAERGHRPNWWNGRAVQPVRRGEAGRHRRRRSPRRRCGRRRRRRPGATPGEQQVVGRGHRRPSLPLPALGAGPGPVVRAARWDRRPGRCRRAGHGRRTRRRVAGRRRAVGAVGTGCRRVGAGRRAVGGRRPGAVRGTAASRGGGRGRCSPGRFSSWGWA